MAVFVGCSGWQHSSWRGPLYPRAVPQGRWLEHYADAFRTVEADDTFYRFPDSEIFAAWARRTPADFVFAVRASLYLTHVRRLSEPEDMVARLVSTARSLGDKLGPVLLQLPFDLTVRLDDLDRTLGCFPADVRVAVELGHDSWFVPELRQILEKRDAALCLVDRRSRPATPLWRTASWGYLRMYEGRGVAHPCYGRCALASWATRLADLFSPSDDVFAYFDNDSRGCAVRDARRFTVALAGVGLRPTRTGRGAAAEQA